MFLQKYPVKPIPLEEAVKLIQVAERARQGRLRAMFMKQIYLQEYRAKQARLLGERVADVGTAALCIQKVWMGRFWTWGQGVLTQLEMQTRGGGELWNSKFPRPTFSRTGLNSRRTDYLTLGKLLSKLRCIFFNFVINRYETQAYYWNIFKDHR